MAITALRGLATSMTFRLPPRAEVHAVEPSARATQAMTFPQDRVGLIEWVTAQARGLSRVMTSEPETAPHIFAARYRFQMRRVHTGPVAAQMIDVQAGRDGTNHPFVHDAVRSEVLAFDNQRGITAVAQRTRPDPASVVLLNTIEYAVQWIACRSAYLAGAATRALAIEDVFAVAAVVVASVVRLGFPFTFAFGHASLYRA
jgi:hypothetical protein